MLLTLWTLILSFEHQCGKDGKVFIIANTPRHGGLDLAIDSLQDLAVANTNQKNTFRTSHDGLRLSNVALDPKHRDAASLHVSNEKPRKGHDQNGDTALHCFEKMPEDFSNVECEVKPPADEHWNEFPEEEKWNWEPNMLETLETDRSADWLKQTWETHVKTKHKRSLLSWNKQTGGGDGTAPSFIDHCQGDRWVV